MPTFYTLFGSDNSISLDVEVTVKDDRNDIGMSFKVRDENNEKIKHAHDFPTAYVETFNAEAGDILPDSYAEAQKQFIATMEELAEQGEFPQTNFDRISDKTGREVEKNPSFRNALARPLKSDYFSLREKSKPAEFLQDLHDNPTDHGFESDEVQAVRTVIEDGLDSHYDRMVSSMGSEYKEKLALNVDWHLNKMHETVTEYRYEQAEEYLDKIKQLFKEAVKKRVRNNKTQREQIPDWRT